MVEVEDVRQAGNYRVSHPGQQTRRPRWLAVNAVKGESDLRTIDEEEQDTLFGGVNVARLDFVDLAAAFARAPIPPMTATTSCRFFSAMSVLIYSPVPDPCLSAILSRWINSSRPR